MMILFFFKTGKSEEWYSYVRYYIVMSAMLINKKTSDSFLSTFTFLSLLKRPGKIRTPTKQNILKKVKYHVWIAYTICYKYIKDNKVSCIKDSKVYI